MKEGFFGLTNKKFTPEQVKKLAHLVAAHIKREYGT